MSRFDPQSKPDRSKASWSQDLSSLTTPALPRFSQADREAKDSDPVKTKDSNRRTYFLFGIILLCVGICYFVAFS